jgi:pimeloyl-ACP methyl ester carboxylesterase
VVWLFVLLGVLCLAVALPRYLELRRTDPVMKGAPGQFADLSQGRTHYRWSGRARGPVAVLIHGLTTPMGVWDELSPRLGDLGYRVLTYDLYGRGLSASPAGRQDRAFFLRQLNDLLAHEGLTEDVMLVGYSMGGSIATAFAAQHPDRVKRLVLIAPAGIARVEGPVMRVLTRLPVIGDWLHAVFAAGFLRRRWAAMGGPRADMQMVQLDRRGFLPALLASLRGILAEVQETDHRAIGRADVPVIAIWGTADAVIPIKGMGRLAVWNRNALQETVEGAGHDLVHSRAADVAEHLRQALRAM